MPAVPPAQFVPCKCKNKCSENFSIESREKMHAQYWSMEFYDQHRQFEVDTVLLQRNKKWYLENLENHGTISPENRRMGLLSECKNVYYNALQVKEKFVRVAVSSATTGIAKQDPRCKRAPANKTKAGNLQMVHARLSMFQKVESHYSR